MCNPKEDEFRVNLKEAIWKYCGVGIDNATVIAIIYIIENLVDNPNFTVTINNAIITNSQDNPTPKVSKSIHVDFEDRFPTENDPK